MPFLETVAGEALSMLWGSKMILQVGAMESLSPLANVRVLLSSNTELRFSIQILSTGPSNTSQTCSPTTDHMKISNSVIQNVLLILILIRLKFEIFTNIFGLRMMKQKWLKKYYKNEKLHN